MKEEAEQRAKRDRDQAAKAIQAAVGAVLAALVQPAPARWANLAKRLATDPDAVVANDDGG
jgi:hypothetical protein